MDCNSLKESITAYEDQLAQVDLAISAAESVIERENLISLQNDIKQLINLTQENLNRIVPVGTATSSSTDVVQESNISDEYALFMAEMEKEGAVSKTENTTANVEAELKSLEGMKCRAPHTHQWGDIMYHNAMICSVNTSNHHTDFEQIEVKVMFINPTHQEMLPCPYYLETHCKFDEEHCKFSHGDNVKFSTLQEYTEPKFENLKIGSNVLAKENNNLWYRATVKNVLEAKCIVKLESNKKVLELELHNILPLENDDQDNTSDSAVSDDEIDREDVINMSLINTPSSQALGDWEKYTKGIGSKIMENMGYVIGTGLGRFSDGRTDPVTAVVLPAGKSLDHCMNLREKAGGDKDLFSVEKKLKRLQKKQEKQNLKAYEREKKKINIFSFLNETLAHNGSPENVSIPPTKHRQEIRKESLRNLNVAKFQIDEDIKRAERDLFKIRESLTRHSDVGSQINKNLRSKLNIKQTELQNLQKKALNISNEQTIRKDKRKLTIF